MAFFSPGFYSWRSLLGGVEGSVVVVAVSMPELGFGWFSYVIGSCCSFSLFGEIFGFS